MNQPHDLHPGDRFAMSRAALGSTRSPALAAFPSSDPVPRSTTIAVVMPPVVGAQPICLGIMGDYVARIYLQVKRRRPDAVQRVIARGFAAPVL